MSQDPAQPEYDSAAAGAASADIGTRIGAKLIDYVILWVVYFVIFVAVFGLAVTTGGFGGTILLSGLVSAVLYVGYFTVLEMTTGQTLGKMLLKLRVEGQAGGNPTFEEALKRNAWMGLIIVPFFLGWLAVLAMAVVILVTVSNSPTNTGWHDQFAGGTSVVKTG